MVSRRRALLALAAVAISPALAGCAGLGGLSTGSRQHKSLDGPSLPAGRAASAVARLDRAIPAPAGFAPSSSSLPPGIAGGALWRCLGLPPPSPVVPARSVRLVRPSPAGMLSMRWSVIVLPTPAEASARAKALSSQAASSCLATYDFQRYKAAFAAAGTKLDSTVEVAPMPISHTGPEGAFSYRLALSAIPPGPQGHFALYSDISGFAMGAALVELRTTSVANLFPRGPAAEVAASLERQAARIFG